MATEKDKIEAILGRNKDVTDFIKKFTADRNKDTWIPVMNALTVTAINDGLLLVPVNAPEEKTGGLLFKIMNDPNGKHFFALFTSKEEIMIKNPTNAVAMQFRRLLAEFLKMEGVDNIVINPWSEPFFIDKEAAKNILDNYHGFFLERRGLQVVKGNIINVNCEAIVNSADPLFADGGGVDHEIYTHAGQALMDQLDQIGSLKLGAAVMTPAHDLKQNFVIHTVGPVYESLEEDSKALSNCYMNCLGLARQAGIHSITFPAISTGASGFPKNEAAHVAVSSINKWLDDNKDYGLIVAVVCMDDENYQAYQKELDK